MEEKTPEEEKPDKLYEGDLNFEEIKNNPILQPIIEVYAIYESMGIIIRRSVNEFDRLKIEIQEMINKNPIYSQTQIVAKMQELIVHAKEVIHSQDVQRGNIKQAMNEMIKIVQKYYELRGEKPESIRIEDQMEELPKKRGRPRKRINEELTETENELTEELPDLELKQT